MPPQRPKSRKLFRQPAIDNFVGVFGDGATPEFLVPRHTRLKVLSVLLFCVIGMAWLYGYL